MSIILLNTGKIASLPVTRLPGACPAFPWLVVISGGFLQFGEGCGVVLDPHLRAGLLQKRIDRGAADGGLILIVFESREPFHGSFFGVVIEVSGDQERAGFGEFEEED